VDEGNAQKIFVWEKRSSIRHYCQHTFISHRPKKKKLHHTASNRQPAHNKRRTTIHAPAHSACFPFAAFELLLCSRSLSVSTSLKLVCCGSLLKTPKPRSLRNSVDQGCPRLSFRAERCPARRYHPIDVSTASLEQCWRLR
jgi:hypothetical protein